MSPVPGSRRPRRPIRPTGPAICARPCASPAESRSCGGCLAGSFWRWGPGRRTAAWRCSSCPRTGPAAGWHCRRCHQPMIASQPLAFCSTRSVGSGWPALNPIGPASTPASHEVASHCQPIRLSGSGTGSNPGPSPVMPVHRPRRRPNRCGSDRTSRTGSRFRHGLPRRRLPPSTLMSSPGRRNGGCCSLTSLVSEIASRNGWNRPVTK